ncbi:MAG: FAD-binding oxidoreductase [Gammaproteobacteria bacterium]|nr:FAD-binding oxidoreductase [Gammaproteobacteria bacterium]MCW5582372.1 FAD-binding oxidoreductase [Gammaproteobacteria bacterium]
MQSFEFNIAIIGGGCIGSSILYELCRRGFKNVVLIDHGRKTLSATSASGGMLRVFHEHLEHIDLSLQNFSFIEIYQQSAVLTEKTEANGHLYFFNKSQYRSYKNNFLKMNKAHYPFEILTPTSGQNRFPQYRWGKKWAVYEPKGNHISPKVFMDDLLIASKQHGANFFDDFYVNRICSCRNRYWISGEKSLITAKRLVLAGGARLLPRLQDLNLRLPFNVKNITTYIAKKSHEDFLLPNYFDRESLHFGCFSHKHDVVLSYKNCMRVKEKPWGKIIEERSAKDIYAPNRLGFLGRIAGFPGLFIATGWGGTAFKFALEIGHRVTNAIEIDFKKGETT